MKHILYFLIINCNLFASDTINYLTLEFHNNIYTLEGRNFNKFKIFFIIASWLSYIFSLTIYLVCLINNSTYQICTNYCDEHCIDFGQKIMNYIYLQVYLIITTSSFFVNIRTLQQSCCKVGPLLKNERGKLLLIIINSVSCFMHLIISILYTVGIAGETSLLSHLLCTGHDMNTTFLIEANFINALSWISFLFSLFFLIINILTNI